MLSVVVFVFTFKAVFHVISPKSSSAITRIIIKFDVLLAIFLLILIHQSVNKLLSKYLICFTEFYNAPDILVLFIIQVPESEVAELTARKVPALSSLGEDLQLHSLSASLPRYIDSKDMPLVSSIRV